MATTSVPLLICGAGSRAKENMIPHDRSASSLQADLCHCFKHVLCGMLLFRTWQFFSRVLRHPVLCRSTTGAARSGICPDGHRSCVSAGNPMPIAGIPGRPVKAISSRDTEKEGHLRPSSV